MNNPLLYWSLLRTVNMYVYSYSLTNDVVPFISNKLYKTLIKLRLSQSDRCHGFCARLMNSSVYAFTVQLWWDLNLISVRCWSRSSSLDRDCPSSNQILILLQQACNLPLSSKSRKSQTSFPQREMSSTWS